MKTETRTNLRLKLNQRNPQRVRLVLSGSVSLVQTLFLCLLLGTTQELRSDQIIADGVIYTSIIRLIAHPELYEGKKVQIIGHYIAGQELSSLYLTRDDAQSGNSQSAIWIGLDQAVTNKLVDVKIKSGQVAVVGTFHFNSKGGVGHLGAWPAELRGISFLQRH